MRVAITGAGGYLGGMLVRAHAARGDAVHALARDAAAIPAAADVTPFVADLVDPARVPAAFFEGVDIVYHCAAEIANESLMRAVNVDATRALLTGARGKVRRWVQVSSLSVYGNPRSGVVTEDTPPAPATLYARTKHDADALVAAEAQDAFGYTIVRPAAIIGRAMRNRSMHALIDAVARGRFAFIGAPGAIGNYVHEENAVEALMACGTRAEACRRTYNVSQNCPLERIAAAIAAAHGVPPPRTRVPESLARLAARAGSIIPGFPLTPGRVDALTSRVEYPSARIERELDFEHRKSIGDALRDLVAARDSRR